MTETPHSNAAAAEAYETLRQTLIEVVADPLAPGAEERLTAAAYAANALMYPSSNGN
ncbi:hypothetical protein ACIBEA_41740 [Streptomyces sp. NPDC051555]|uniref:hypothetical protein n=1 Tax=Streptomyces sp. NPDC051555 TaxID=3365657 RepID=UPI003795DD27